MDSSKSKANKGPQDLGGATTREMSTDSPRAPLLDIGLVALQVVIFAATLFFAGDSMVIRVVGFALALGLFVRTWGTWAWWSQNLLACRIMGRKNLKSLEPGNWVVRPGSRRAVRIKEVATGVGRDARIADGLTVEELEIIAPVYVFRAQPTNSQPA